VASARAMAWQRAWYLFVLLWLAEVHAGIVRGGAHHGFLHDRQSRGIGLLDDTWPMADAGREHPVLVQEQHQVFRNSLRRKRGEPEMDEETKEEIRRLVKEEMGKRETRKPDTTRHSIGEEDEEDIVKEIEKEVKRDLAKEGIGDQERMSELGEATLDHKWVQLYWFFGFLALLVVTIQCLFYFTPALDPEDTTTRYELSSPELLENAAPGLPRSVIVASLLVALLLPLGVAVKWMGASAGTIFWVNLLAVVPEAYLLGYATEELAILLGDAAGALLNATFGNTVEVIFVYFTLKDGLIDATIGSLVGSIISNHLVLLGLSFLVGGVLVTRPFTLRLSEEASYDVRNAMNQAQQLLVSSFTVTLPAVFSTLQNVRPIHVLSLGQAYSFFLVFSYIFLVFFQLKTTPKAQTVVEESVLSCKSALCLLMIATLLLGVSSEIMVHSLDEFCHGIGLSQTFVGVVVLPIAGDISHMSAIYMAMKNKMDLAINIAMASAIQIALVVVPISIWMGAAMNQPMTLGFQETHGVSLILSAIITFAVLVDGHSNWLRGSTLLTTWMMVCLVYFFMPDNVQE